MTALETSKIIYGDASYASSNHIEVVKLNGRWRVSGYVLRFYRGERNGGSAPGEQVNRVFDTLWEAQVFVDSLEQLVLRFHSKREAHQNELQAIEARCRELTKQSVKNADELVETWPGAFTE